MNLRLHHLGFACESIDSSVREVQRQYVVTGMSKHVRDHSQNAAVCIVDVENSVPFEFVSGPAVANFLRQGQSLYHVCFECDDLDAAIFEYVEAGAVVVSPPKSATLFDSRRVCFLETQLGLVELLERSHQPKQSRMVLLGNFALDSLGEFLRYSLSKLQYDLTVTLAPFGQIFQQLLDPSGQFAMNTVEGFNVIVLNVDEFLKGVRNPEQAIGEFTDAVERFASSSAARLIICLCSFRNSPYGQFLEIQMKEKWNRLADVTCEVFVDNQQEHAGDDSVMPFGDEYLANLALAITRETYVATRAPFKMMVLDCDDTLWEGACSELGARNVKVSEHHLKLQKFLIDVQSNGMLLCLSSKNIERDVFDVFARNDKMLLQKHHLADCRVNWSPKSANIKAMASSLGVALQSVVVLDDNPIECAEIQSNCPACAVVQFRPCKNISDELWFLHSPGPRTSEDELRTKYYLQNQQREQAREQFETVDDFISKLELVVEISSMTSDQQNRVVQLTKRTTQFNLSPLSIEANALQTQIENGWSCETVSARDRFGDYGLIGVVFSSVHDEQLIIHNWLLSCRVLNRGVEQQVVAHIIRVAMEKDCTSIVFRCSSTERNAPIREFMKTIVGIEIAEDSKFVIGDLNHPLRFKTACYSSSSSHRTSPTAPEEDRADVALDLKRRQYLTITKPAILVSSVYGYSRSFTESEFTANEFMERLSDAIHDTLGAGYATLDEELDFFEAGGDSLKALRLISRLRTQFDINLTIDDIYDASSFSSLIKRALQQRIPNAESMPARLEGYPLSSGQQALWRQQTSDTKSWVLNMPIAFNLVGPLDIEALNRAIRDVCTQHESLRTVFRSSSDGDVEQIVLPSPNVKPISIEPSSADEIESQIESDERQLFDLEHGPLIRIRVFRISHNHHVMSLIIHHIVCDGWSYSILFRELSRFYRQHVEQGALGPNSKGEAAALDTKKRYVDFVRWEQSLQESSQATRELAYWRESLNGYSLTHVRHDQDCPKTDVQGRYSPFEIDSEIADNLRNLCTDLRTSRYTGWVSAIQLWLAEETQVGENVIGTVAAIRDAEFEDVFGFMVNAFPIRYEINWEGTFEDIVRINRQVLIHAFQNRHVCFGRILESCCKSPGDSLFQVIFLYQNTRKSSLDLRGLQVTPFRQGYNIARADLVFEIEELDDRQIQGGIYYRTDRFRDCTVKRFGDEFMQLLRTVVRSPRTVLADSEALTKHPTLR